MGAQWITWVAAWPVPVALLIGFMAWRQHRQNRQRSRPAKRRAKSARRQS
jgi:hypothetical protein